MSASLKTVALAILASLAFTSIGASAQELRVKCSVSAKRSSASVDAKGLSAGSYSAILTSGGNTAQSPLDVSVDGEVEFDFDSNAKDIHKGATAIAPDFIVGRKVTGTLLAENGETLLIKSAKCRQR